MARTVTSENVNHVHREVTQLLAQGAISDAVRLADSLEGDEFLVTQLRGIIFTEGGEQSEDAGLLERGRECWESLGPESNPSAAYNLANAELGLFMVAVGRERRDYVGALENARSHLQRARELFLEVGENEEAPLDLRVQALTNAGNSFDNVGRDLESLELYRAATELDPTFGMALGNAAVALSHVAVLMRPHSGSAIEEARQLLGQALKDRDRIISIGGAKALATFEEIREELAGKAGDNVNAEASQGWSDSHLDWCLRNELFLHVSHSCLREDDDQLDPLYMHHLHSGLDDAEQLRIKNLIDAFNAIKQDYVAARYSTWLASAPESPIRDQAAELRARVTFLDTLEYGRWGLRTGMATAAFAAATNLLDKVANFVHLYLETERDSRGIYFTTLWHPRNKLHDMDPELAAAIKAGNRGLLALCDLSCDLERDTPLARLLKRRHAATHRFVVAHSMGPMVEGDDRIERLEWDKLIEQSIEQLRTARAAIIYLARTIDINEAKKYADADNGGTWMPMPMPRVDPEFGEID